MFRTSWHWTIALAALCIAAQLSAQEPSEADQSDDQFRVTWHTVEPGYALARYVVGNPKHVLKSEILLLRFNPKLFDFSIVEAKAHGSQRNDIKTLANKNDGIAAINTHFFDPEEQPLGIIISDGKLTNRMHRGGSLLTGVFYIQKDKPQIVHRSQFIPANNVRLALQAGPRLVEAGKPLQLKSPNAISRRSGIAVTKDGEIVMFATILRFPGASLQQIQDMLLDPRLAITDALNLDGGGSSQLFVRKNSALPEETFITGGDVVPVGLVVRRKKEIK